MILNQFYKFYIYLKFAILLGSFIGVNPLIWDSKYDKIKVSKKFKFYWRSYYIFSVTTIQVLFLLFQAWKFKHSPIDVSIIFVFLIFYCVALIVMNPLTFSPNHSSDTGNALLTYLKNYSG